MADQRPAAPLLPDEGGQAVFDPVLLADARWKMADRNFQPRFAGELL